MTASSRDGGGKLRRRTRLVSKQSLSQGRQRYVLFQAWKVNLDPSRSAVELTR